MNLATIALIVVAVLIMLSAGIYFLIKWKSKKPYKFLLHHSNGVNKTELVAHLIQDEAQLGQQKFLFDDGQKMDVRPPTTWRGAEAIRDIFINELGEYAYLKPESIDKDGYNKLSLTPEEKSIALYRYKENANRYANPMSKLQAYMLFGAFFMAFIILIGVIYCTATYVNMAESMVELQKEINKGSETMANTVNILNQISTQQIQILGSLQSGGEIVRPLT